MEIFEITRKVWIGIDLYFENLAVNYGYMLQVKTFFVSSKQSKMSVLLEGKTNKIENEN